MHWLGKGFREEAQALSDAYAQMYAPKEEQQEEKVEQEELSEGMPMLKGDPKAKIKTDKSDAKAAPMPQLPGKQPSPPKFGKSKTAPMPQLPGKQPSPPKKLNMDQEEDLLASLSDAYAMMYEKKKDSDKCGDDTYWDKEEKKCKSKKKKSGTTVVVGRGGIYGPGYHGGGSGSNGGGDTDTDGGDTDGGGGDGGGGGE